MLWTHQSTGHATGAEMWKLGRENFQVEPNRIFEPQKCDWETLKDFETLLSQDFCARRLTCDYRLELIYRVCYPHIIVVIYRGRGLDTGHATFPTHTSD